LPRSLKRCYARSPAHRLGCSLATKLTIYAALSGADVVVSDIRGLGVDSLASLQYEIPAAFRSITGDYRLEIGRYTAQFTDYSRTLGAAKFLNCRVLIEHAGQVFARGIVKEASNVRGKIEIKINSLADLLDRPCTAKQTVANAYGSEAGEVIPRHYGRAMGVPVFAKRDTTPGNFAVESLVCAGTTQTPALWVYRGEDDPFTAFTHGGNTYVRGPSYAIGFPQDPASMRLAVRTVGTDNGTYGGILKDIRAQAGLTAAEFLHTFSNPATVPTPLGYSLDHTRFGGGVVYDDSTTLGEIVARVASDSDCALTEKRGVLRLTPFCQASYLTSIAIDRALKMVDSVELPHRGIAERFAEFRANATQTEQELSYGTATYTSALRATYVSQMSPATLPHPSYTSAAAWLGETAMFNDSEAFTLNPPPTPILGYNVSVQIGYLWQVTRSIPPQAATFTAEVPHGDVWPGECIAYDDPSEGLGGYRGLVLRVAGDLVASRIVQIATVRVPAV
jgi:hypothetical protein